MDFFLFFIVFPLKEEEKKCWKGKVATRRVRINAESAAPGDKKTCKKILTGIDSGSSQHCEIDIQSAWTFLERKEKKKTFFLF
jgi:hypothetical protein